MGVIRPSKIESGSKKDLAARFDDGICRSIPNKNTCILALRLSLKLSGSYTAEHSNRIADTVPGLIYFAIMATRYCCISEAAR